MNGGFCVGGTFRKLGNINRTCVFLHSVRGDTLCSRTPVPLCRSQGTFLLWSANRRALLLSHIFHTVLWILQYSRLNSFSRNLY
ncbi:hypothetical protein BDV11DRAFT_99581 [Aspergillus similis]